MSRLLMLGLFLETFALSIAGRRTSNEDISAFTRSSVCSWSPTAHHPAVAAARRAVRHDVARAHPRQLPAGALGRHRPALDL